MKNSIIAGGIVAAIIALLLCAQSCTFVKFDKDFIEGMNDALVIDGSNVTINTDNKKSKIMSGEGEMFAQDFNPGNFTSLTVDGASDIKIVHGNEAKVSVAVAENLVEYLQVKNMNKALTIKLDSKHKYSNAKMEIRISTPLIEDIEINGAGDLDLSDMGLMDLDIEINGSGDIKLNNIAAGDIDIEINGAGKISTNELDCSNFDAEVNGSGTINLVGKARAADIEVSGTGVVDVSEFECDKVNIDKNGLVKVRN